MSADADKLLILFLADEFHPFMTDRTAGVGKTGNPLPVTAFSVLTHEQFSLFAIHSQQSFSTLRTMLVGQIIMAESPFPAFDRFCQIRGIMADFFHERTLSELPVGYTVKLHLPLGGKLRLL